MLHNWFVYKEIYLKRYSLLQIINDCERTYKQLTGEPMADPEDESLYELKKVQPLPRSSFGKTRAKSKELYANCDPAVVEILSRSENTEIVSSEDEIQTENDVSKDVQSKNDRNIVFSDDDFETLIFIQR